MKQVGEETFRLARELVDEFIVVDTDAVCAAIKDVFEDTRSILEPAGALGVAGDQAVRRRRTQRSGETYVAITCGANMNFDRLRFVAERAEVGEEREALFAVTIPEERGSFRRFCELIGAAPRHRVQLPHRRRDAGARVRRRRHRRPRRVGAHRRAASSAHGFADARPDRRRAGQGARAPHGRRPQRRWRSDERLYRFEFPERPGALMRFLSSMQPGLEHQPVPLPQPGRRLRPHPGRHAGADDDDAALQAFLDTLGYPYVDETANPVYRLFLG